MQRFAVLMLAVVVAIGNVLAARPTLARQEVDQATVQAVVEAARQVFQVTEDRTYNALYDLIHPDAHAVIPREVVLGAFAESDAAADADTASQVGEAQVVDVQFGDWTWPVTGTTYQNAAEVTFAAPYTENGVTTTRTGQMYLVEYEGAWRWFFGNSKEAVDQAIARYTEAPVAQAPATSGELLQFITADLDSFYRKTLAETDYGYASPGVRLVGERSFTTACGPASGGFWAFYCPEDDIVYLDGPFLADLFTRSDFAVAFVIGHEWAHHVQTNVGIERAEEPDEYGELYSVEIELMADCLTGVWAQDADTRGVLSPGDIEEAVDFAVEFLGDPPTIETYDPRAHGTGEQRANAIMLGYKNGFLGCNETL